LKYVTWDNAKNEKLRAERGISFEDVVFHIERGDILDIVEHPNQDRYRGERVTIVQVGDYAYLVPCLHEDECVVLKDNHSEPKSDAKIHLREAESK
jgi:uncharacterized DUF497 family protein